MLYFTLSINEYTSNQQHSVVLLGPVKHFYIVQSSLFFIMHTHTLCHLHDVVTRNGSTTVLNEFPHMLVVYLLPNHSVGLKITDCGSLSITLLLAQKADTEHDCVFYCGWLWCWRIESWSSFIPAFAVYFANKSHHCIFFNALHFCSSYPLWHQMFLVSVGVS